MTKRKTGVHYVNNAQFLEAMKEWKDRCKEAEELGDPQPPVSNYIGECFLKIANHLSYRPNFINYTYRDEMISDGIEEALLLQRWIHFAETNTYDIPKSQIIVLTEASYGLSKFYEYCVNKSKLEDETILTGAPTNRELDDIEEEEWDEEFGEPHSKLMH